MRIQNVSSWASRVGTVTSDRALPHDGCGGTVVCYSGKVLFGASIRFGCTSQARSDYVSFNFSSWPCPAWLYWPYIGIKSHWWGWTWHFSASMRWYARYHMSRKVSLLSMPI